MLPMTYPRHFVKITLMRITDMLENMLYLMMIDVIIAKIILDDDNDRTFTYQTAAVVLLVRLAGSGGS